LQRKEDFWGKYQQKLGKNKKDLFQNMHKKIQIKLWLDLDLRLSENISFATFQNDYSLLNQ